MNAVTMTSYDHVKNAAHRLRAIRHNRPPNETDIQQRETDDRVMSAEADLEKALIEAGVMTDNDAIESIEELAHCMKVSLDSGRVHSISMRPRV